MKYLKRFWLVVVLLGLVGCGNTKPILVGLSVELTGQQADVGINIRDAALMAVDEINAQGGVNGRPIELVVRDDEGEPDIARQVDAELVDLDVVAIIGHYTSGQAAAVIDQMNEAQVVLISPSASSSDFTGKQDYFFRLIPDTALIGRLLAEHIALEHSSKKLVGVYDDKNRAFSLSFWEAVDESYRSYGGESESITFTSGESDLRKIAEQVKSANPDAVTIIASSVDTAVLAQYLRNIDLDVPLFTSPWAQTTQLVEKGGQAVEGMEISGFYNLDNKLESHRVFAQKFRDRFGREPQLGTSQAYECVLVLAEALKATDGSPEGLREALKSIKDFPGVLGPITFDLYGDVHRDIYILQIENGQIVEKETISPGNP